MADFSEIAIRIAGLLLRGGHSIPPERELAGSLGTSRVTLRRALRSLEDAGLVEARRGSGVRVRPQGEWSLAALPWLLRAAPPASPELEALRPLAIEALALRRSFARSLPATLAGRLAKGSLARARKLAVEAWGARAVASRFVALDGAALRSAVEAAGAPAAVCLWNDLSRPAEALAARLSDAAPVAADYVARLDELWDALEAGDTAQAERRIAAHLARLDRALLAVFEDAAEGGASR